MSSGERFKQIRLGLGLKQREIGDKLGYKQFKIGDIEKDKQKVTAEIAQHMEELFNVNGWWLLTGIGKPYDKVRLPLGKNNTYDVSKQDKENMAFVEELQAGYGKQADLSPDIQTIIEVLKHQDTKQRMAVLKYALNLDQKDKV